MEKLLNDLKETAMNPTDEQIEQILNGAPIKDWTYYCTRNRQYIKRDDNTDMLFVHTNGWSTPLSNSIPYCLERRERLEEILALRQRVQELEQLCSKLNESGYNASKVLALLPRLLYSIEIKDWYSVSLLLSDAKE